MPAVLQSALELAKFLRRPRIQNILLSVQHVGKSDAEKSKDKINEAEQDTKFSDAIRVVEAVEQEVSRDGARPVRAQLNNVTRWWSTKVRLTVA